MNPAQDVPWNHPVNRWRRIHKYKRVIWADNRMGTQRTIPLFRCNLRTLENIIPFQSHPSPSTREKSRGIRSRPINHPRRNSLNAKGVLRPDLLLCDDKHEHYVHEVDIHENDDVSNSWCLFHLKNMNSSTAYIPKYNCLVFSESRGENWVKI